MKFKCLETEKWTNNNYLNRYNNYQLGKCGIKRLCCNRIFYPLLNKLRSKQSLHYKIFKKIEHKVTKEKQ